jgi:hypothetical protein
VKNLNHARYAVEKLTGASAATAIAYSATTANFCWKHLATLKQSNMQNLKQQGCGTKERRGLTGDLLATNTIPHCAQAVAGK